MSWWWRTKPRSILRTIQWFPFFGALENQNWDEEVPGKVSTKDHNPIHPIRRNYIYNAHGDEDTFLNTLSYQKYLSGQYDRKETESNGRNDKTTFEFFGFGYVNQTGAIKVTDVGRRIMQGKFDDEDFLKQLLKLQFPNNIQTNIKGFEDDDFIYPLQLTCMAIKEFGYLNRSEIVLLFGCCNINKIDLALDGIHYFRERYVELPNKNDTQAVRTLCEESYRYAYSTIDNKIASYYDYAEAFCRSLVYTGLFKASGRSIATKIRVPEYNKSKLDMIINNIQFDRKSFSSVDDYMLWYGDPDALVLPWDNVEERKKILAEKFETIRQLETESFIKSYGGDLQIAISNIIHRAEEQASAQTNSSLKDAENTLTGFIVHIKEAEYIRKLAQTTTARKEILDKYDEILDTIDMGALWLEVNTWKSLLALAGEKTVKRNFNVEEDLTPKSFAPGIGNTPDMEMYTNDYIIIPEVSLMTGVQQWEHEASSVIDHVLAFINDHEDRKVFGLFISTSINIRTKWQFFILNKESWVTKPVPVIPLTIKQYKGLITKFYANNANVDEFTKVIEDIHQIALTQKDYNAWFSATNDFITKWEPGNNLSA